MPDKAEMQQQLAALRQGTVAGRKAYHIVHEFGKADFVEARPEVEALLKSEDAQLRAIALEVLTRHWRLVEYLPTAQRFLEHDPDIDCRMKAASAFETLLRNTKDRKALSLLARVVRNEQEKAMVREAAYAAIKGIIQYDPREQFQLAAKGINLSQDVDWKVVDSYLK